MELLSTKEKQKLLYEAITEWKLEYKKYKMKVNSYLFLVLTAFIIITAFMFFLNDIAGYICLIATSIYALGVVVPSVDEASKVNKCNLNNVHNIKVGVLRRKYYKQRKFSIFLAEKGQYRELDVVRATDLQFNFFRVGDKIICFEFYPKEFAVTYMPAKLNDDDIKRLEKDIYTPSKKDVEGFAKFRREITLYDNYLFYALILIILVSRNYYRNKNK